MTTVAFSQLGDRIQELEEEIEAREARERELEAELNTLDAGIEESEAMHEQVVATLKEVGFVRSSLARRPALTNIFRNLLETTRDEDRLSRAGRAL